MQHDLLDPSDPRRPGYQQPPEEFVIEAKHELGDMADWSVLYKRAWELKAEEGEE